MDFGRVDFVQEIKFALPPDAAGTTKILQTAGQVTYLKPEVYVGCPTWNNKPWQGSYYPVGIKAADQLPLYSKQFNTIELNTTHYRIPDATTISRWRESVTPNFTFCPKLPQVISHELQLKNSETFTKDFCDSLRGLEEHLGSSFLQLPPTFGPGQLDTLMRYLDSFPRDFPLALELREEDWFRQNVKTEELWALLEAYNLATVITDVAGRRDVLHMRLTNATAFIRFVGNGLHPTDYTRIDDWVARLHTWFDWGLQKLYFFIHQQDIKQVPVLISYFLDKLDQTCGIALDKPKVIPQPVQGRLF